MARLNRYKSWFGIFTERLTPDSREQFSKYTRCVPNSFFLVGLRAELGSAVFFFFFEREKGGTVSLHSCISLDAAVRFSNPAVRAQWIDRPRDGSGFELDTNERAPG